MQKRTFTFIVFIIFLSFSLIALVYAAGSSTGNREDSATKSNVAQNDSRANQRAEIREIIQEKREEIRKVRAESRVKWLRMHSCEDSDGRKERIKCRLEKKAEKIEERLENKTEESCRGVKQPEKCEILYKKVQECYEKEGRQKDQCFKRAAGFIAHKIKDEINNESKREYLVFVLYNLQERIEDKHAAGNLTDEEAAKIIDMIVSIKQLILNGENRDIIKPKIQELRKEWQNIIK